MTTPDTSFLIKYDRAARMFDTSPIKDSDIKPSRLTHLFNLFNDLSDDKAYDRLTSATVAKVTSAVTIVALILLPVFIGLGLRYPTSLGATEVGMETQNTSAVDGGAESEVVYTHGRPVINFQVLVYTCVLTILSSLGILMAHSYVRKREHELLQITETTILKIYAIKTLHFIVKRESQSKTGCGCLKVFGVYRFSFKVAPIDTIVINTTQDSSLSYDCEGMELRSEQYLPSKDLDVTME